MTRTNHILLENFIDSALFKTSVRRSENSIQEFASNNNSDTDAFLSSSWCHRLKNCTAMFNSPISAEYDSCTVRVVSPRHSEQSAPFAGNLIACVCSTGFLHSQAADQYSFFTAWLQNMFVPDEVGNYSADIVAKNSSDCR